MLDVKQTHQPIFAVTFTTTLVDRSVVALGDDAECGVVSSAAQDQLRDVQQMLASCSCCNPLGDRSADTLDGPNLVATANAHYNSCGPKLDAELGGNSNAVKYQLLIHV